MLLCIKIYKIDNYSSVVPIALVIASFHFEISSSDIFCVNDEKLFPNGNSWYYVHEGLLYAYIEFPNGDSYCYMGNRNNKKEGEC